MIDDSMMMQQNFFPLRILNAFKNAFRANI